jgi:c(7)-type cytochrome triheme protein
MKSFFCAVMLVVGVVTLAGAQGGVKKKRPKPFEYGTVTINNFSTKAGLAPVQFEHWRHRGKFTCRVCHVDLAFAMTAGATQMKAADNMHGYYCGACHNGKLTVGGKTVFSSCSTDGAKGAGKTCERCHVSTPNPYRETEFQKFAQDLPKARYGNGIDWEKAEELGMVKPADYLEGVSIKKPSLGNQKDFAIGSKVEGMPDIIFSHKKHTVWNGCELCHPEIFVGIKKGSTKYSMVDIFENKYCGVCHVNVAFPLTDCQRCHAKPVQ